MRNERLTDRLGEVTNKRRNIAVSEVKRGKLKVVAVKENQRRCFEWTVRNAALS